MITNHSKKWQLSLLVALLLLGLLASWVSAAPAAAEKQWLVKGRFQANETFELDFANMTLSVDATGSGNATQLGRFTVSYEAVVQLFRDGTGTATPSAHFVAANGDSLFAEGSGLGVPTEIPGVNRIVEKYTITGGTGRFAGASGSFTVERLLNLATGVTSGTFKGSIVLP